MPVYDVDNPGAPRMQWNLTVGPPGQQGARPAAELDFNNQPALEIMMGQQVNVALNGGRTGVYTRALADCSAFCLLYRPPGGHYSRAAMIHMPGGPDPAAVNWPAMAGNMPVVGGAVFFAILANRNATVLTDRFLAAIAERLPQVGARRTWVYNGGVGGSIDFGVEWGAFAGQPN